MKNTGLQLIGKGLFSKVYRLNDTEVLVKSVCIVKECISMGWHTSEGIFPVIKRVDDQTYVMEYYDKVPSLKDSLTPEHYAIYKNLKSLSVGYVENNQDLYREWYKQFETIENEEYRDALIDMMDNLINYGSDIQFEISPRNVAVKDGKLILLDVFFVQSKCLEVRSNKKKRKYSY